MSGKATSSILEDFNAYISSQREGALSKKTDLWQRLLSQRQSILNFDVDQQLTILRQFLSPHSAQASGTGRIQQHSENGTLGKDLEAYVLQHLDPDYLRDFKASSVGCPETFSLGAHSVNMAYIWNLLRFQTYHKILAGRGLLSKDMDVLEIGPGYGCAALLWIQTGLVRSYTVIDLKENMINAVYYLSKNLPDWNFQFVDASRPVKSQQKNTIYFLTPENLDEVGGDFRFDFALNSDSLGEMPATVAKTYIGWIHRKLRDGGHFVSMNGHRRGQSRFEGVAQVSEYGYSQFDLVSFVAKPFCTSGFDDFGHVAILKKEDRPWSDRQARHVDTLANLYACGLNTDIADLSQRFSDDQLTSDDIEFLTACDAVFRGGSHPYAGEFRYIVQYLEQLKAVGSQKPDKAKLYEYLASGKSEIARLYCLVLLLWNGDASALDAARSDPFAGVRLYFKEFARYHRSPAPVRSAAFRVRLDNIRKKINPYERYRPSSLVKLKNLYFNWKDDRRLSTFRG